MLIKLGTQVKILKAGALEEVSKGKVIGKVIEEKNPDFLYFRAIFLHLDDGSLKYANGNGDVFPREEGLKSYSTFINKHVDLNHDTSDMKSLVGKIIDAYPIEDEKTGECYIEGLCKIDRKANPEIARQIETGILDSVSMEASVESSECLTAQTEIFTTDGWKRIKHIKIGDEVLTHKGRFKKVIRTFKNRPGKTLLEVSVECGINKPQTKFNNLVTITMTPNHPVLTKRGWVKAEELTKDDEIQTLVKKCVGENCDSTINFYKEKNSYCSIDCVNNSRTEESYKKAGISNSETVKNRPQEESLKIAEKVSIGNKKFWESLSEEDRQIKGDISARALRAYTQTDAHRKRSSDWLKDKRANDVEFRNNQIIKFKAMIKRWVTERTSYLQKEMFEAIKQTDDSAELNYYVNCGGQRYYLDVALPELKIDIECDGEAYHSKPEDVVYDEIRNKSLEAMGWTVIRFPGKVLNAEFDECIDKVQRVAMNHSGQYEFGFKKISNIKKINTYERYANVYNLQVEDDESYIAKGLVVHNCSICGNVIHTELDKKCEHFEKGLNKEYEYNGERKKCYSINSGITFTGLGIVTVPADGDAKILSIISSLQEKLTKTSALDVEGRKKIVEELKEVMAKLDPETNKQVQAQVCTIDKKCNINSILEGMNGLEYSTLFEHIEKKIAGKNKKAMNDDDFVTIYLTEQFINSPEYEVAYKKIEDMGIILAEGGVDKDGGAINAYEVDKEQVKGIVDIIGRTNITEIPTMPDVLIENKKAEVKVEEVKKDEAIDKVGPKEEKPLAQVCDQCKGEIDPKEYEKNKGLCDVCVDSMQAAMKYVFIKKAELKDSYWLILKDHKPILKACLGNAWKPEELVKYKNYLTSKAYAENLIKRIQKEGVNKVASLVGLKKKANEDDELDSEGYPKNQSKAERIAISFVNGNISWVRKEIGGSIKLFNDVLQALEDMGQETESFRRLMTREASLKEGNKTMDILKKPVNKFAAMVRAKIVNRKMAFLKVALKMDEVAFGKLQVFSSKCPNCFERLYARVKGGKKVAVKEAAKKLAYEVGDEITVNDDVKNGGYGVVTGVVTDVDESGEFTVSFEHKGTKYSAEFTEKDVVKEAAKTPVKVSELAKDASAFDVQNTIIIGEGFTAVKDPEKKVIVVKDKEGKEVGSYVDAFGDDMVSIMKFFQQMLKLNTAEKPTEQVLGPKVDEMKDKPAEEVAPALPEQTPKEKTETPAPAPEAKMAKKEEVDIKDEKKETKKDEKKEEHEKGETKKEEDKEEKEVKKDKKDDKPAINVNKEIKMVEKEVKTIEKDIKEVKEEIKDIKDEVKGDDKDVKDIKIKDLNIKDKEDKEIKPGLGLDKKVKIDITDIKPEVIKPEVKKSPIEIELESKLEKANKEKVELEAKLLQEKTLKVLSAKNTKISSLISEMIAREMIVSADEDVAKFQREGKTLLDARELANRMAIDKQKADLLKMDDRSLAAFESSVIRFKKTAAVKGLSLHNVSFDPVSKSSDSWMESLPWS